jgi:hypothetical protein
MAMVLPIQDLERFRNEASINFSCSEQTGPPL